MADTTEEEDSLKILFITSGSIGDAIISTGILGYLMDEYPTAEFTVATGPASVALFEQCPRITKVISMRKQPWNKHWFQLWLQAKETMWDLIVDLRGSVMAWVLNAHHRKVFMKPDKSLPKAEQLAKFLDVKPPPASRLWVSEDTRNKARALLPAGKVPVVISPKTNAGAKDWPIERFAELAQKLYKEGVVFVLMGTSLQHQAMQPFFRIVPQERILDLCGKTDLPTAYAVLEQGKLFIGNDSGLLHMAAAAKTPSVGIYGPTNDKTYAPRGENIRIVTATEFKPGEPEKRDNAYMKMIKVEKVEAAVRELGVL